MSDERNHDILRVFQTRDQTRAFYDKISRFYDALAERSEAPLRERGLELLAAHSGESALEVGCGTGSSLEGLARACGPEGRVVGVDLSPGMLDQARLRLSRAGVSDHVSLLTGDAADLPFDAESFDAVFISFTLELFDTPEIPVVLGELARVLRPAGRLCVVGMSKKGPGDPLLRFYEWTHRHFPNFIDCRPIFVCDALEAAGFRVRSAEILHIWLPVEVVLAEPPRS